MAPFSVARTAAQTRSSVKAEWPRKPGDQLNSRPPAVQAPLAPMLAGWCASLRKKNSLPAALWAGYLYDVHTEVGE